MQQQTPLKWNAYKIEKKKNYFAKYFQFQIDTKVVSIKWYSAWKTKSCIAIIHFVMNLVFTTNLLNERYDWKSLCILRWQEDFNNCCISSLPIFIYCNLIFDRMKRIWIQLNGVIHIFFFFFSNNKFGKLSPRALVV